jgi:hypothetical protein
MPADIRAARGEAVYRLAVATVHKREDAQPEPF